jgi:hypothetical protein
MSHRVGHQLGSTVQQDWVRKPKNVRDFYITSTDLLGVCPYAMWSVYLLARWVSPAFSLLQVLTKPSIMCSLTSTTSSIIIISEAKAVVTTQHHFKSQLLPLIQQFANQCARICTNLNKQKKFKFLLTIIIIILRTFTPWRTNQHQSSLSPNSLAILKWPRSLAHW